MVNRITMHIDESFSDPLHLASKYVNLNFHILHDHNQIYVIEDWKINLNTDNNEIIFMYRTTHTIAFNYMIIPILTRENLLKFTINEILRRENTNIFRYYIKEGFLRSFYNEDLKKYDDPNTIDFISFNDKLLNFYNEVSIPVELCNTLERIQAAKH